MMSRLVVLGTLLVVQAFGYSCSEKIVTIAPQGEIEVSVRDVGEFDVVKVSGKIGMNILAGMAESEVVVETYENLQKYLRVDYSQSEKSVWIYIEDGVVFDEKAVVQVNVKVKGLVRVELEGMADGELDMTSVVAGEERESFGLYLSEGSIFTSDNLKLGKHLNASLSGDSEAYITTENTLESSSIELSGGSEFMMKNGGSKRLELTASGGSLWNGYTFIINQFVGDMSGASTVNVGMIDGTIKIVASGASVLNYKGNAEIVSHDLSGGSQIIKIPHE